MIDPPDPGLPPDILLMVAQKLGWHVVMTDRNGRELGQFTDPRGAVKHFITIRGATIGQAVWHLETTPPQGFASYLIPRDTATVLALGQLNARTGAVMYKGASYCVCATWDGQRHVAELVQV